MKTTKTSAYQEMEIEELMKACVREIHTDPASVADIQDILAHETEERLAEVAKTDKNTFLRITRKAWSVEDQFKFYDKFLSPYIEKLAYREEEAFEAARERDVEIVRLERELQKVRNAVKVLKEI